MSLRGQPSTAHVFHIKTNACVYCGMYQVNVEKMSHECTLERETWEDARIAKVRAMSKEANDHGE